MSNNLGRTEVAVNQTNKEDAVNASDARIDAAITAALTITWAAAEALKTVSTAQMQQHLVYVMAGSTTEPSPVLKLADVQRGLILVKNGLAQSVDVTDYNENDIVAVGPGVTVAIYATSAGVEEIFVPVASGGSYETLADGGGSFTGHGLKLLRINATEDGVEYLSALDLELLNFKEACRVATTAAITIATALNSGDSIDGVTLANGDRVLVKNQAAPEENGIYIVSATPARATDFDADAEVRGGTIVAVSEGTTNGNSAFMLTTNDVITVGTTGLVFATFGGGGGSTTLIGLTDFPANYTSDAKKKVRVNAAETALEFVPDTRNLMATFGGVPGVSVVVFAAKVAIPLVFPASMAGSYVTADVAATAQTDFDIQKNGASQGTIRFAAAGTTATYVSVAGFSLAAGDELKIISPNPADATLADLYFSFLATAND